MRTTSENAVELVVFDIADELGLTDAEVHALDLERLTASVLTGLRLEIMRDVGRGQPADRAIPLVTRLSESPA